MRQQDLKTDKWVVLPLPQNVIYLHINKAGPHSAVESTIQQMLPSIDFPTVARG